MKAILFPTRKNLVKEDLEKAKKKLIDTNWKYIPDSRQRAIRC